MKSQTQAASLSMNLNSEALMSTLRQVAPHMVPARQYREDNEEDSFEEERQQHGPNHEYNRQMASWQQLASALQFAPLHDQEREAHEAAARQREEDEEERARQVRGAADWDQETHVYDYQKALDLAPAEAQQRAAAHQYHHENRGPYRAAHQDYDDHYYNYNYNEGGDGDDGYVPNYEDGFENNDILIRGGENSGYPRIYIRG
ncbi:hypothetical protein RvY_17373 [Ramazzottius varieornatus]|uniref:Uncharacterized protein n=1 Tax=Ramazzottius varieornatus TaxID=947166 RepID=A0A1D1W8Z2_RAMVA|nr:hypothetical protein RvY_17373 [Ramazzottius varieornatus]